MKSRMKKSISAAIVLFLISVFLLSSAAGAATKKLTVRVYIPKTVSVYAGCNASINLKLSPYVEGLQVKYASRNKRIATVTDTGIVIGMRKGTTTITTTVGSKAFRTTVKVLTSKTKAKAVESVAAQPAETLTTLPNSVAPVPTSLNVPGSFVSVGCELDAINKCRVAEGLLPLTINNNLTGAAQIRAYEASVSFSHTRPDGTSVVEMIRSAVPSSGYVGENLALAKGASSTDAQYIVNLWMNSSGHRENILRPAYTQVAIAAYQAPNGTVYWSQLFLSN